MFLFNLTNLVVYKVNIFIIILNILKNMYIKKHKNQ